MEAAGQGLGLHTQGARTTRQGGQAVERLLWEGSGAVLSHTRSPWTPFSSDHSPAGGLQTPHSLGLLQPDGPLLNLVHAGASSVRDLRVRGPHPSTRPRPSSLCAPWGLSPLPLQSAWMAPQASLQSSRMGSLAAYSALPLNVSPAFPTSRVQSQACSPQQPPGQ